MARTAKKAAAFQKAERQVWNAGIYARLSVDGHNHKNESIETQIQIAKEYIKRSENIALRACYTDLGKTGTNFERDGFQELLADIRQHKINCVIVKDFSRFGRNYIETGNYIEKLFPFFNVRFISVSDGYDSHQQGGDGDAFAVNLKHILNELYARDCAEKVRAVKKAKLEQGNYVGGAPPYGFCAKWVGGKKILFPENGTSDVVRQIYEQFDGGSSIREIISCLYGQRVHRPSEYRRTGHVHSREGEQLRQWPGQTVRAILANPAYIGVLAQVRAGGRKYRSWEWNKVGTEEAVMAERAHEPIVSEDIFYRAASKIEAGRRGALPKKSLPERILEEDVYKGLAYCGECGSKLKRIGRPARKACPASEGAYFYGCPNIHRVDAMKCGSHFVPSQAIDKILLETLGRELRESGIPVEGLAEWNQSQAGQRLEAAEKEKRKIQAKIQNLDLELSSLYMRYRAGKIRKGAFLDLKANKEAEKNHFKMEWSEQERELHRIKKEAGEMDYLLRCLWKGKEGQRVDGQMARCLVKRIAIYKDRRVELLFSFSKEPPKGRGREAPPATS